MSAEKLLADIRYMLAQSATPPNAFKIDNINQFTVLAGATPTIALYQFNNEGWSYLQGIAWYYNDPAIVPIRVTIDIGGASIPIFQTYGGLNNDLISTGNRSSNLNDLFRYFVPVPKNSQVAIRIDRNTHIAPLTFYTRIKAFTIPYPLEGESNVKAGNLQGVLAVEEPLDDPYIHGVNNNRRNNRPNNAIDIEGY